MQKLKIEFCPVTRQYIHKNATVIIVEELIQVRNLSNIGLLTDWKLAQKFLNYEHYLDPKAR